MAYVYTALVSLIVGAIVAYAYRLPINLFQYTVRMRIADWIDPRGPRL